MLAYFLTLVLANFQQEIQSFFFFSEVVGKVAICRGGIFLVFAHPYARRIFHKILNQKNRTWAVFSEKGRRCLLTGIIPKYQRGYHQNVPLDNRIRR